MQRLRGKVRTVVNVSGNFVMHPTRAAANKGNLVKGLEFVAHILNGPPERAIVLLPTFPAFIDVIAVGDSEDSGCSPTGFHCTLGSNFLAHSITSLPHLGKIQSVGPIFKS